MKRWEFYPASPQSDINWEDYTKDSVISRTKTVILWIFLLLLSVVMITPVLILEYLSLIVDKVQEESDLLSKFDVSAYLTSLSAMIVSIILIPFFIDMMVQMEDFRTKSERQVTILNRNFLFMMLNLFFLNLTGFTTIKSFLYEIEKTELQSWP